MKRVIRNCLRTLGALLVCFTASTAFAFAGITVNKSFAPNSIALGATSVVTVTLQNDSTSSAATITAFSDDIGTTMAGHASLLSSPAPTTTCSGGTPTVAGQVVSMSNGQIPIAPSVSTPGSCTITFSVAGTVSGNGFNTISAANVVTSLGSPGNDVTQTLNVQGVNVTATGSSTGTVQINDTNTVTFVITNPAAVPLTSAAFPITSSASLAYTVSGYTTSCGGTATLPAALGTTGTTSFSGLTIPASGTCTVTLSVTSPNSTTATFTLNTGAVSDAQGATNGTFVSTTAAFKTGKPAITKTFSPTGVTAGGTTTLTLNIPNALTIKPLTNAAISDVLPGSLTISGTPTANANCGSPTLGGTGTGTLTFSGGTIAANATCTITAIVNVPAGQAAGTLTNTVPAANFTSTEVALASTAATANLFVTAGGGGVTTSQSAAPTSANVGVAMKITINFTSVGAALTAGSFTDVLPQTVQPMVALTDGTHVPTFSAGCGSNSPTVTFGGTGGNTTVSGSNLTLTSGGTCAVGFWVAFTTATSTTQNDTNTLLASNVTFTGSAGTIHAAADSTVVLMQVPTFSINNYLVSNSGLAGQPLTVNATLYDSTGTADTNAVMVVNLTAGKVQLAPTPNFTFSGCPAGFSAANIAINGAREQFTATLGSINATCSIGYDVINETGITGTFAPTNSTYKSTLTGGSAIGSTATNNVTFATTTINITKAFSPNQIQSGGVSTADITLTVPQAGALALTQANGVAFSDALPANVTFSPTPNVTFTGCAKSGQPAPAFSISGTTISISNVTLVTTNATQTACDVKFDVTSSVVGAPLNQIAASAVTSASGITNTQSALASLTVNSGLGIAKTFLNPSFQIGGTDYVRFLVTNSASSAALSGGTIVDAMPATLVLASTTLGAIQTGDPTLCGGSVAGPVGTGTLNLSGLAVAGLTSPTAPGQCVVYVQVKASASAAPGSVSNTIAAGGLNVGGYINQTAATGSVTLTAPPNDTVSKTFTPALIVPGAASVLSIVVDNTAVGAAALSGMALTDTLPTGVQIAATPNASTTCGAGTLTAVAASASVALASGSVAANATCTITVSVTGTGGTFTNTIAANSLTTTQGATNAAAATATLTVASITLSKAFLPATISSGAASTLTITIPNGTTALTGVSLTDTLPTGVTIAAAPNAATTCPSGTVNATAGGSTVALTGGTLAASATCTITANVTGTAAATYTNTIAANALHTTQTITNPAAATANLTIGLAGIVLTKAFAPATIIAGGTSVLTVTIPNTAPGAVALSGVSLTDTLPSGVTIAATPNAATTCPTGAITATAGGTSLALAGGTLAANATCTLSVNVTGTVAAAYTNTINAGALSTTPSVTNATAATAILTIAPASIVLTKAFAPATITAGGSSILTISIPNTATGAVALTNVALTDTLPSGVTIAATPNAATTCPAGTVTATAGGTSVALAAGTLAANATCTMTVSVTGTVAASYTNTILASALSTTEGVSNATAATASLTISPASITLSKAFAPATIVAGGTSTLTITIPNTATGAVALTNVALTDTLPSGVTIAATPNAVTSCPAASVTAAAGGASVALAAGTLAANATCTFSVSVTGTAAAGYTNTINASALTTTQGVSNAAAATASLTITSSGITLSKAFLPAAIVAGGTSTLTITIPNTAPGAVALTAVTLTDTLPTGVVIAATPNAATTCPAGNVTATAGGTSVALTGGTLAANVTCTIVVHVTGTTVGSYVNTIATNALSTAQSISNSAPATATIDITAVPDVTLAKAFSPATILQGATSLLTITVNNMATSSVPLSGLAFSDAYPAGLVNAATPAATTTCPAGSVTAVAGTANLAIAGATLAANASCTITVNVAAPIGTYSNTVSSLTTTQGATNVAAATASLSVTAASAPTITNTYAPPSILTGGISTLAITIANTGTSAIALGNVGLTDTLLAGVTIAPVPNASTTCPSGVAAGSAGGSTLTLAGASLAAGATCTLTVDVTSATVGAHTNTIAANALSDTQLISNAAPASTTLTVGAISPVTIIDAFSPPNIASGQTSLLTISIANTGSSAVALTGVMLTDALPTGMTLAATPAGTTTCVGGSLTAAAGATSVALGGATLAAGASCSITVTVTSTTLGVATDTIPVSAFGNTQTVPSAATVSATLTVTAAPAVTLTQVFAPPTIVAGTTSVLTLSVANTASGAVSLTGIALSDALPAGLVLAAIPNASTTCSTGPLAAVAGAASFALSAGTLGANTSCTISVTVTASAAGAFSNAVAAGTLTSTQGATNAATTATLSVTAAIAAPLTLTKTFSPTSIVSGGASTLTVTIANEGSGAVALTSLAFADAFPPGVFVAALPAATTTCGAGIVAAQAGTATLTLASGSLAAGASCTVSVGVTSAVQGSYVDTSAVGAVGDTQNVTNPLSASASLSVTAAPAVALSQAFAPASITAGATSLLTLTFANSGTGAVPLTGIALADALPAGIALAAVPNAATTCTAASVTAVANATTFTLSAASLAVNASCTLSVNVIAASPGAYTNAIAAAALTSVQGATNAATQAILTVTARPQLGLTQAFAPATIVAGTTSVLTLVVANTAAGAVALSGLGLADTLPAGVVIAATPNARTTCPGGTVSAVAGASSFALSAATLSANASCTIVLTITASSAGVYTNAIAAAAITDAQHVTNAAVAATLTVTAAASLRLTKTSDVAGAGVAAGQTVAYSIAIVNAGTTVVTGAKLTDVLTNGSLVAGSVTVNGAVAADAVVNAAAPFGSIAAGATVTIRYRATVAAHAASGVQLTNSATAGSDQGCAGAACAGAALPDTVLSPPKVDVKLWIDGKISETVTLGQVVTYTAVVTNVGGSDAQHVTLSDTLPAGVTPIAGSLTTASSARRRDDAGARSTAKVAGGEDNSVVTMTTNGQTVEASLGTVAVGASSTVAFRATITLPITTVAQNLVTIGATGIANTVTSNPVVARMVKAQLTVTKTASAVVAQIGDRVNYVVHVALPGALAFGKTTIVDQLPDYLLFAPGSARLNGSASVPTVSGHTLTWTLPTLGSALTLTYATSIAAGASANATLNNLVTVNAMAAGAGPPASGSASAAIQIASSTFGTCYPITGRVFDDAKHSGRFESGDAGLAGVSIVLDDGESAVTDSYGRYNFPCVRQGMHALRLDEQTLPAGSAPYPDRAIDSERSTRRLVHSTFDDTILQDVNFAIGQAK